MWLSTDDKGNPYEHNDFAAANHHALRESKGIFVSGTAECSNGGI
jgi:hypothetical protein